MSKYQYANSKTSRLGRMICATCGKPVEGEFRWSFPKDSYVVWHRACCAEDKEWAKIDKAKEEHARYLAEYEQACREFVAKWGYPAERDFDV